MSGEKWRLDAKVAVVTGAGSGIGRALAEGFAAEGASVLVADLNEDGIQDTVKAIEARGGKAIGRRVDVTKRAEVAAAMDAAIAEFGGLDVCCNIAGINIPRPFLEVDEQNVEAHFQVNVVGVLLGIQEAASRMISAGTRGKLINVASVAGRQPAPEVAAYSLTKAAVISLTQSAAKALAPHGINVNAFSPGLIETPMIDQNTRDFAALDPTGRTRPEDVRAGMSAGIPLGRPGVPDDLVGTVLWLATSDSDYVTGQTIQVDGGIVMV